MRPHDIAILTRARRHGAREATVERVVHLGFEVRVELVLDGGERVSAQVTRNEADAARARRGRRVWVRTASDAANRVERHGGRSGVRW